MSTNPYAAPRAQVADETIVLRGNFIPGGRGVPAGNGWSWIADGWTIFRAEPGMWVGMALLFGVMMMLLAMIPFVGALAMSVLWPVFTAGFVIVSRTIDQGGDAQFSQLFAGFKHRFGPLVTLGVISLVISFIVMVIIAAALGVGIMTMMGRDLDPEKMAALGVTLVLAFLIYMAVMLPIVMATWFAVPLIAFHEIGPLEAMKQSFVGCLKNIVPFLLYGLILLLPAILATLPIMLGWLILGPVIAASVYTGYRNIYFADEAAA